MSDASIVFDNGMETVLHITVEHPPWWGVLLQNALDVMFAFLIVSFFVMGIREMMDWFYEKMYKVEVVK